ncbi:MAG: hypothetical protein IK008_03900 [Bacteroidales bacterium]|nr:hypothetical protein [Bacteroidales bacterium]
MNRCPVPESISPVSEGNSFEIITSGLRKRELLLKDLEDARSFIHIEYFRFGCDSAGQQVREILMKKAAEGVEVRILNNNWSGLFSVPRSFFTKMIKAGVEEIRFTHIQHGFRKWFHRINHQQHRKIVVIDGRVAYTGGMNLNDNYFYRWRDTHLRITGPAVARYSASFLETWRDSGGRVSRPPEYYLTPGAAEMDAPFRDKMLQVVEGGPELQPSAMLRGFCRILADARNYVYLCTPYFVPPYCLLDAIKDAARRGVDVRLMLPENVDTPMLGPANRGYYTECLEAGVRIFERGGIFVHSKTLVSDDALVVIGTSNLDERSFRLNYEVDTLIFDEETARYMRADFEESQSESREILLPAWKREWRWPKRVFSALLKLFRRQF